MAPLPSEVKLLLDTLIAQVQQVQSRSDQMYSYVAAEMEKIRQEVKVVQDETQQEVDERLKKVDDDIKTIRDELRTIKEVDLKELQKAIITKQEESYKRIIGAQGAILLLIISSIVALVFQFLHH